VQQVVLARPHDLDRRSDGLADLGRLHREVGVIAPAEAAAHERRVDDHFLARDAGDLRDHVLRPQEGVAQDPEQRGGRIGLDGSGSPVQDERHLGHARTSKDWVGLSPL
jgi:hypothetical protein